MSAHEERQIILVIYSDLQSFIGGVFRNHTNYFNTILIKITVVLNLYSFYKCCNK